MHFSSERGLQKEVGLHFIFKKNKVDINGIINSLIILKKTQKVPLPSGKRKYCQCLLIMAVVLYYLTAVLGLILF